MEPALLDGRIHVISIEDAWNFYANKHGKTKLIRRAEKIVRISPDISFEDLFASLRIKVGSTAAHFAVNYLYHVWDHRERGLVHSMSPRGALLALWYFGEIRRTMQQGCVLPVSEFYLSHDDVLMYFYGKSGEPHA